MYNNGIIGCSIEYSRNKKGVVLDKILKNAGYREGGSNTKYLVQCSDDYIELINPGDINKVTESPTNIFPQ